MDRNLIEYLPDVMKGIGEMTAITQAEQPQFAAVWDGVAAALQDQFIGSATANGVTRWENILHIIPKATEELDTRKFRILTRLNEQLPYTMRTMMQQLETLCGAQGYLVMLQAEQYILRVTINMSAKSNFESVKSLLDRTIPANMIIYLSLKYNEHARLAAFRHQQLAASTHYELRNEVLKNAKSNGELPFAKTNAGRFL